MTARAIFLDRDGTLNVDTGYADDPGAICLLPGVRGAIATFRRLGYRLFLHTNQSGVGRGYFTLETVAACNARLREQLGFGDDVFTATCVAPELPGAPGGYRKPSPRFLLEQIALHQLEPAQCWMVGDRRSDWETGLNAGVRAVAVQTGKPISDEDFAFLKANPCLLMDDLAAFAAHLESTH